MSAPFLPALFAREVVSLYVERNVILEVSFPVSDEFSSPAGAFVSIKTTEGLRGCMGTISPQQENVVEEIAANAIMAATRDPRFSPIVTSELSRLYFSVDILGQEEPIDSPRELDPIRYGVIVRRGHLSGLLLPNLEGVESAEHQVAIAMQKAGITEGLKVSLSRFAVTRYGE